ncbi:hypothetical protein CK489_12695 [Bradyrhizobium sp. UFLA03-84]|nr:hypothetical protein CK489_12695 [Bradyrhizobium sp. UFLA03-84]
MRDCGSAVALKRPVLSKAARQAALVKHAFGNELLFAFGRHQEREIRRVVMDEGKILHDRRRRRGPMFAASAMIQEPGTRPLGGHTGASQGADGRADEEVREV